MKPRQPIFGREKDLQYLLRRVVQPGITVVSARPQQGKTRLLEELVYRLRFDTNSASPFLCGYAEGRTDVPDLLLRAVLDLYKHWLTNSTWLEQARAIAKQRGGDWVQKFGDIGQSLASLLTTVEPTGIFTSAIRTHFSNLVSANQELSTGGLEAPRLTYEQVRDTLWLVHDITNRNSVLMLDATDQLRDINIQLGCLKRFLERVDEWPPCHFVLACRDAPEGELESSAYSLAAGFQQQSALCDRYLLGGMDIEDIDEQDRVLMYLHETIPSSSLFPSNELLSLLDNYPGTLRRWQDAQPTTLDEFTKVSKDANAFRYREIEILLKQLYLDDRELFNIASRMILLPESKYSDPGRDQFASIALNGRDSDTFTHLFNRGLIVTGEGDSAFSFGLTSRYLHARQVLLTNNDWRNSLNAIASKLIYPLLTNLADWTENTHPYMVALAQMSLDSQYLQLGEDARAFCRFLFLGWINDELNEEDTALIRQAFDYGTDHPEAAPILSIMYCRYLTLTKFFWEEGDNLQRYGVEFPVLLRELHSQYRTNTVILRSLAVGIGCMHSFALAADALDVEQKLLQDLRELAATHTDVDEVALQLALRIQASILYGVTDGNFQERQPLLDELRELSKNHGDSKQIRKIFVGQLLNFGTAYIRNGLNNQGRELLIEGAEIVESQPDEVNKSNHVISDADIARLLRKTERNM